MSNGFDDIQKFGKEHVGFAVESADAVSKGIQALTSEAVDYSKKSFEAGTAAFEDLLAARSLDKAMAVQSEYMRSAYEGYVGRATKFGEIFADMAKSAYKPYETFLGKYGK